MSKLLYTTQIAIEVEVDAQKPTAVANVGTWLASLGDGKFLTPPEGSTVKVRVTKQPDLVRKRG